MPKQVGRKGKYNQKIVSDICRLLSSGEHTIKSICEFVDIHQCTYFEWLSTKPEFAEAIKKAEQKQERNMVNLARRMIYKRMAGYDYDEVLVEEYKDAEGKIKSRHGKTIKKHVPPDTTALIFTIKNYENGIKEDSNGNKNAESLVKEIELLIKETGLDD